MTTSLRSVSPIGGALVEAVRKLRSKSSKSPLNSTKPSASLPFMNRHKRYLDEPVVLTSVTESEATPVLVPSKPVSLSVVSSSVVQLSPSSRPAAPSSSESLAACAELLELCGRQEKELDRLRKSLQTSTAELDKWQRAFTVLPARRFDALTLNSLSYVV